MSGHSKWAQIKRQKGTQDKKKGQIFSKLVRTITVAAREGGGDVETNFRLRIEIDKAREVGMPQSTIERAIKRATGDEEGKRIEEVIYEGYGPFGTAFLIETATDNKNRTVNSIKHILTKAGGNLGASGSVAWQFLTCGQILVAREPEINLADLELAAIDAGAEDVRETEEGLEINTMPIDLNPIREKLAAIGAQIVNAEIIKASNQIVQLSPEQQSRVAALYEELDNDEDVTAVYTNANL